MGYVDYVLTLFAWLTQTTSGKMVVLVRESNLMLLFPHFYQPTTSSLLL